jgi:hypothetical protein
MNALQILNADINYRNSEDKSALSLVDAGADINQKNENDGGKTEADYYQARSRFNNPESIGLGKASTTPSKRFYASAMGIFGESTAPAMKVGFSTLEEDELSEAKQSSKSSNGSNTSIPTPETTEEGPETIERGINMSESQGSTSIGELGR